MLQQTEQGPPLERTNAAVVRMSDCPRLRILLRALERIIRWAGMDMMDFAAVLRVEELPELTGVQLNILQLASMYNICFLNAIVMTTSCVVMVMLANDLC
jgi:hypothetical protein